MIKWQSFVPRVVEAFARSWQWFVTKLGRSSLVRAVISEGGLDSGLRMNTLYVVTEDGVAWQAAMLCPCGCGDQLDLNLLPDERPCWRVMMSSGAVPSLTPSVWRTEGCNSHFFLREGRIVWVE